MADELNDTHGTGMRRKRREDNDNDNGKQDPEQHTETDHSAQNKHRKEMNPGNKMVAGIQQA